MAILVTFARRVRHGTAARRDKVAAQQIESRLREDRATYESVIAVIIPSR